MRRLSRKRACNIYTSKLSIVFTLPDVSMALCTHVQNILRYRRRQQRFEINWKVRPLRRNSVFLASFLSFSPRSSQRQNDVETFSASEKSSRYDTFFSVPLSLIRQWRRGRRAFSRACHRVVRHIRNSNAAVSSSRWQCVSCRFVRAAGRTTCRATTFSIVIFAVHSRSGRTCSS